MDSDFSAQPLANSSIATSALGTISGTVGALVDEGDDFILQTAGGERFIIDSSPLEARQLDLIPGETLIVEVAEREGFEIDTARITRPDGSVVLGASGRPFVDDRDAATDFLTGERFDTRTGEIISGTVGALVDEGDDFILQTAGGERFIIDSSPLEARQLGLIPGETLNVEVAEREGFEIDTTRITRPDGSVVLGTTATPPMDDRDSIANFLSGEWFDARDYLERHADVAAAGVDAWQHFLNYGAREGRLPEVFDADFYLSANPDVAAAGVDAWQHFLDYGWREGRLASAIAESKL